MKWPHLIWQKQLCLYQRICIVAQNKSLKLNFLSEGIKDCVVNGDKDKIHQVVLNFIDNSIKYTKKGEINVKVERVNDKVVFSVSDTGMGMTPEIKETLFHKFSRGDGARMNTLVPDLDFIQRKRSPRLMMGMYGLNPKV